MISMEDAGSYVAWISELELAFRRRTGLSDRGRYKILYSHIHRFPLVVLGYNPGGEPGAANLMSASSSFFENWEHDYVRFRNNPRYSLAGPVYALLCRIIGTEDPNVIRQVPATNVIFRRSRNMDGMAGGASLARESAATLQTILQVVDPQVVLLISKAAYNLFVRIHCSGICDRCLDAVTTPNGTSPAVLYTHCTASLRANGKRIRLLCTGHPSKYSSRAEWSAVIERIRADETFSGIDFANSIRPALPQLADH